MTAASTCPWVEQLPSRNASWNAWGDVGTRALPNSKASWWSLHSSASKSGTMGGGGLQPPGLHWCGAGLELPSSSRSQRQAGRRQRGRWGQQQVGQGAGPLQRTHGQKVLWVPWPLSPQALRATGAPVVAFGGQVQFSAAAAPAAAWPAASSTSADDSAINCLDSTCSLPGLRTGSRTATARL